MELTGNGKNKYAFQSEEMEATSDEVVAFEEDNNNNNNNTKDDTVDERTDQEKVESLPLIIQKIFKWQMARHRHLTVSMCIIYQGLNMPLFYGYLFNNAIIGIVMGVYNILYAITGYSVPDYGTGEFLNMYVKNKSKLAKVANDQVSGTYFMTFICTGFFFTFQILALNPESQSHNVFGWITPYLIYANFVIYPLFSHIVSYTFLADMCTGAFLTTYHVNLIKAYMAKIKECLLKYDVKKDNKDECLEEISRAQTKIEKVTLGINTAYKMMLGFWLVWLLGVVTTGVIMIWILQTLSANGSHTNEIVGLSCITVLTLLMFIVNLSSLTTIAKTWESERKMKLNDSRLQIKIDALFGQRFNEWMDNHESKASRAFNFQITPTRVMEIGSVIGSLCTVAAYFIIREELRAFMQ